MAKKRPVRRNCVAAAKVKRTDPPDWFERILNVCGASGGPKQRGDLWCVVNKIGLTKERFGDLASQVQTEGFCRVAVKNHALEQVAARGAKHREIAQRLAFNARDLANQMFRILRARMPKDKKEKPTERPVALAVISGAIEGRSVSEARCEERTDYSDDAAIYDLLWDALFEQIEPPPHDPDETPVRLRLPDLVPNLYALADTIEGCLKSRVKPQDDLETQAHNLRTLQDGAFMGRDAAGRVRESIVGLLTDSNGLVHYAAWKRLLELFHPDLKGKVGREDLKRYAQRTQQRLDAKTS
jgi:hypothetical protein